MDWQKLFLSPEGRIGRQQFWIGWAILLVAGFVLGMVPVLGQIIGLLLIYPNVCVYSKRLHDMGKTAWLQLIPYAVFLVSMIVGVFAVGWGAVVGAFTGAESAAGMGALAGLGLFGLLMVLSALVAFGFLIWIGATPGEPGQNRFGPPAGQSSAEVFS